MKITTKRHIDKIILHCSDTYEDMDIGVKEIRKWHTDPKPLGYGWSDCGYHFIIRRDGKIETGRPLDLIGSHCYGQNTGSIGICWVGGLNDKDNPVDNRTDAQKKALAALVINIQQEHPQSMLYGHNDFSSKSCPNFDAQEDYYNFDSYLFM